MPTTTTLFVHVPVDKIMIVKGPEMKRCLEIRDLLNVNSRIEDHYVAENFRLTTPASSRPFRRTIQLASISLAENYQFNFTALFNGLIVSGVYDARAWAGWFSLD